MKKRILCIAAILLVITAVLCCECPAYAEETVNFTQSAAYHGKSTYFYDETNRVPNGQTADIGKTLKETAEKINFNLGIWVGSKVRTKEECQSLAKQGTDMLDAEGEYSGSIFIYLDMDDMNTVNDIFFTSGNVPVSYSTPTTDYSVVVDSIVDAARERFEYASADEGQNIIEGVQALCEQLCTQRVPDVLKQEDNFKSGKRTKYQEGSVYFYDEAALFDEDTQKQIISTLASTSDNIGFNLALYIGGTSRSDSSIEYMARSNALSLFDKKTYSGTVFLYIDFDGQKNAYDYLYAANDAFLYYTNGDDGTENRIDSILWEMEAYFPSGGDHPIRANVKTGIETYCRQLEYYKSKGLVEGIYYTNPDTGEYVYASFGRIVHSSMKPYKYWFWFLLFAVAGGIILAIVVRVLVKNHYKFKSSVSASAYTSREDMRMVESSDTFIGSHVSKVAIQSGSHGGFGGGGHGGGHVGGGGGGHHR